VSRLALLVTGAGGQLGADLLRVTSGVAGDAPTAGDAGGTSAAGRPDVAVAHGLTRAELDITDGEAVRRQVGRWAEGVRGETEKLVCVNAAAYTAVDAAQGDADRAYAVNVRGAAALAGACNRYGVGLIQVSTDYVFAGDATVPYQVDAPTGPRSVYGSTKLAGEQAVRGAAERCWVVRTAWLYGQTGGNFVKTMVRLERARETLDVVDDQCGSPTWSADLARGLVALAGSAAPPGVYHCTNGGQTTWYGLARAVFEELGADPERVRPTTTAAFPRPAPRPAYSVLSDTAWRRAGLPPLPHWREALHTAFTTAGDALRAG
jgi:dTDP-4-dehydrorhamnose reductase